MPTRRKPASAVRRSRIAAAAVLLLVAGVVAYLALKPSIQQIIRPTGCTAGPAAQGVQLSVSQAGIAAVIAGVASEQQMPIRAVAIAYATALQESKLADLDYGTADSVGVFQQRPSQGWGSARQIENPVYATSRFFAALRRVPHYRRLPIYQAAQDVQHSADGSAYAQYATMGTDMALGFTGADPHGVWCSYGSPVGRPRLAAARQAMASVFGSLPGRLRADPLASIRVHDPRQGWAVAAWLVSHAASYGISRVEYRHYQWLAGRTSGRWTVVKPDADAPGGTPAVLFG